MSSTDLDEARRKIAELQDFLSPDIFMQRFQVRMIHLAVALVDDLAASRAEASALRAALVEIHGKTHALFASPWSRDSLMLQETMTRQARRIEEILLIAQAALGQEG